MHRTAPRSTAGATPSARACGYRAAPLLLFVVLVAAACAPRELPPQLAYTPGPPYTLTDDLLITDAYTVETPAGWRVIAGPAEDPYTFQFVAPDNAALIVLSDHAIADPPRPRDADPAALSVAEAAGQAGGRPVYAALVAPSGEIDALRPHLDALVASLR